MATLTGKHDDNPLRFGVAYFKTNPFGGFSHEGTPKSSKLFGYYQWENGWFRVAICAETSI
jgi:hypothetical protein